MSLFRQSYCTLIVCLLCVNVGIMLAWPSSTIKIFSSTNTTLNRPMTETELALFGSLSSVAALIGTTLAGFLIDFIGTKYCCMLFALPPIISWALISTIPRVDIILISVFVSGLSGCMLMIAPNFISELCQKSIRGSMTSGAIIFYGIGLMVSYILGGSLSYNAMNYVCLAISVVVILLVTLLKESPTYLMKKGFDEKAANSLAFYRSARPNSKNVLEEMEEIRRALNPKMDDKALEEENLNPESQTQKKISFIQFIKRSRSTRCALTIVLVTYFLSIFQGLIVVQVYSEPLFEEALPSVSANLSSILFALINTIAGFVSAYLLDYLGRRPVIIYSSLASSFCCVLLGTQIQLHWGPHWLTVIFVYAFCIACTIGAGTAPYVISAEIFLPEVKSIMTMLATEWAWICNFSILFVFNPLVSVTGLGAVFYLFAIFSLITGLYTFKYLPETNGLTVDVIQTLLINTKTSDKS